MTNLFWIIITTFLISLIAFMGVLVLFLKEKILNKILLVLVSFTAGALIGGAFLHLIPEAIREIGIEENGLSKVFLSLIFGFCIFFVLEQFLKWHHHHSASHPEIMSFSYLILVSSSVHNFIDGLIVAGSFMAGLQTGLVTALAVALHEIPQKIGDYGVLIYGGFKKIKALFLSFFTSVTVILGGIMGFIFFEKIDDKTIFLLPIAAGGFIYVAASDLIPQIKEESDIKKSVIHFLAFLSGIGFMLLIKILNVI